MVNARSCVYVKRENAPAVHSRRTRKHESFVRALREIAGKQRPERVSIIDSDHE